jgi:hypothetical protein
MSPGKYDAYRGPDFIIIGSQKGGTSSLYHHLTRHPHIRPAARKEVHFFDENYSKGLAWYRSHFPPVKLFNNLISGEASPYYLFHPLAPQRVFDTFPDIKLIVMLRNPVNRAYSHYQHNLRRKRVRFTFEEAIAMEPGLLEGETDNFLHLPGYKSFNHRHFSYLTRGIYIDQLERWTAFFSLERFMILKSEDFFSSPDKILMEVFAFLGVGNSPVKVLNKLSLAAYPRMQPETREKLVNYFKPYNQRLYDFLGRDFGWETEVNSP